MRRVIKRKIKDKLILGKKLLREAGIEDEVEVIVEKERIILTPVLLEEGWALLQQLGRDAAEGSLKDVSEKHDEYLYSREPG